MPLARRFHFYSDRIILAASYASSPVLSKLLDEMPDELIADALYDAQILSNLYRQEQLRRIRVRWNGRSKLEN